MKNRTNSLLSRALQAKVDGLNIYDEYKDAFLNESEWLKKMREWYDETIADCTFQEYCDDADYISTDNLVGRLQA